MPLTIPPASPLFSPNPPIAGLPTTQPPPQAPLLPAGTAGAAFTSNPTIQPTPEELAEELVKLQLAATANQPDPSLVINKPGAGRPPEETNDPEKIEKQNAVALIRKYNKVKRDTLSEDIKNELTKANKIKKDYYDKHPGRKIKEEQDEKDFRAAEKAAKPGAAGGN